MAPVSRPALFLRVVILLTLGLAAALTIVFTNTWRHWPSTEPISIRKIEPPPFAGAISSGSNDDAWVAMGGVSGDTVQTNTAAAGSPRFRLAGTFFVDSADGQVRRKAIIDDLGLRTEQIVGEGDSVGAARVEQIFYDHVRLLVGGSSEDVWLDFGRGRGGAEAASATNAPAEAPGASATNRFGGAKLQADRWQFSRQGLLNYYQELLDEPDRMVTIFDSLKPVRDDKAKITGYVVGVEGEAEFFKAIGLQNGDIVRKVNSVPMTSRRRAEFFIDEFLKDRMNVVVLDIERGDQPAKQVYLVRP